MLRGNLGRGFDERRLRRLLTLFFLLLAIPTAALIWHAYGQLRWESFHQYRGTAEALTRRIDATLDAHVSAADERTYADYGFLVVSGDANTNFLQRSPLSAFPVDDGLPGVIGHFQVDAGGTFTTPLLPPDGTDPAAIGISDDEMSARRSAAANMRAVLADNRLVRSDASLVLLRSSGPAPASPPVDIDMAEEDEEESASDAERYRGIESAAERQVSPAEGADRIFRDSAESAMGDEANGNESADFAALQASDTAYTQDVFDELSLRKAAPTPAPAVSSARPAAVAEPEATDPRSNAIGKLSEIRLDDQLEQRSEQAAASLPTAGSGGPADAPARAKRREQTALPESTASVLEYADETANLAANLRVSTFESEVDPFSFSMLDSGHLVLFRNVWRDNERFVQGALIDRDIFLEESLGEAFLGTVLADMSNMIVAYGDDVLLSVGRNESYVVGSNRLNETLLYRSALSAPLDGLELVFTVAELPAGPGATVLGWVTVVLLIVFAGGYVALYRLGLGQIRLAQQQQDFVSAVSHELKTPLTSIRMYGEMLKEGWADESKRQDYYDFIHDESERLTRMIGNVLQLASITRNEPEFQLKPRQVAELMSNIQSKIGGQVERAGFRLDITRDTMAADRRIEVDDDCFTQIIINLVDNALKFSKDAETPSVEFSSELRPDNTVQFSVRDFGPGIPRDQMKQIFKLFYRSENELTRETVGTGIGLAIVQQLATAMGGTVDVINAKPGAKFSVAFPVVNA